MNKTWRDSASLILAVRHSQTHKHSLPPNVFQYDYHLLCLKRQEKSSFMPGSFVFPGGTIDPADSDIKWTNLFSKYGFDKNSFRSLYPNTVTRPSIFQKYPNELPREIGLRIAAIRETFEECGILMCKKHRASDSSLPWGQHLPVSKDEVELWQDKVHNNSSEFYQMCENLECYPDLWALHEWSNWMTPTSFKKRFDTVFYLACLKFLPDSKCDEKEMIELKWESPQSYLTSETTSLPPPQLYEMARIAKFECLDKLLDFGVDRSKMGVQLMLPVQIKLKDGHVTVLPGDTMYPEDVSLSDKQVIDKSSMTFEEFHEIASVKNRFEHSVTGTRCIVDNYESKDGHMTPLPVGTSHVKDVKRY